MIDAEYEAYWDCPECQCLTTQFDDEHIAHNNGDVLSIKCKHEVDKGGLGLEKCEHEYKVNLAV